jgi:hypothetical protein
VTGPEFSEVDLDQLADYAAGVLDPAGARAVADLIATRPARTRAHAHLVAAERALDEQLNAYARVDLGPMPGDVIGRLDRALAGERLLDPAHAEQSPPRHLAIVRTDIEQSPPIARRSLARRSLNIAAAAAATVAALIGGLYVVNGSLPKSGGASSADAPAYSRDTNGTGGSAPGPRTTGTKSLQSAEAALYQVFETGTDYQPDTLYLIASASSGLTQTPQQGSSDDGRLPPTAVGTCVSSVLAAHPGTALAVDQARYQGQPAIVVLIAIGPGGPAAGKELVVAVRADCASAPAVELGSQVVP